MLPQHPRAVSMPHSPQPCPGIGGRGFFPQQ